MHCRSRNLYSRNARNAHSNPRTIDLTYPDNYRGEFRVGDAQPGQSGIDLGLHADAVGFESRQSSLLTIGQGLDLVKLGLCPLERVLELCQGTPWRDTDGLRIDAVSVQHPGLGQEPVGTSGGQSQHGAGVMSNAVNEFVGPRHATVVVAGIQCGCQNRRR